MGRWLLKGANRDSIHREKSATTQLYQLTWIPLISQSIMTPPIWSIIINFSFLIANFFGQFSFSLKKTVQFSSSVVFQQSNHPAILTSLRFPFQLLRVSLFWLERNPPKFIQFRPNCWPFPDEVYRSTSNKIDYTAPPPINFNPTHACTFWGKNEVDPGIEKSKIASGKLYWPHWWHRICIFWKI